MLNNRTIAGEFIHSTSNQTVILLKKVFCIFGILCVILGTMSNMVTCCISRKPKLKRYNIFKLLFFTAIMNLLSLYQWNVYYVLLYLFEIDLGETFVFCPVLCYFQHTTLQASAWLLVTTTIDRYLGIKYINWNRTHFKGRKVSIVAIFVIAFFVLMNLPYGVLRVYEDLKDGQVHRCSFTNIYDSTSSLLFLVMYSLVPSILLIVFNSLLVAATAHHSKSSIKVSQARRLQHKKMTYSFVRLTFLFIASTLPTAGTQLAVVTAFFQQSDWGEFILFCCHLITFIYHASTFPIMYYSNRRIRDEFKCCMMQRFGIQL